MSPIPDSAHQLLQRLRQERPPHRGERLLFDGVGDRDVYNIAAPFVAEGRAVIAGRVEARDTEDSQIHFFEEGADGTWRPIEKAPVLPRLQDPCVTTIDGELIVGGVEFPVEIPGRGIGWRMLFYRGAGPTELSPFLQGPDHMKDIRLVQLPDGRIGVCSRPQGERGGRGTIGFTVVERLDDLTAAVIDTAPLLQGQFLPEEWGGANELHNLADGRLGVLGHIAWMTGAGTPSEEKHYYPMVFELDPATGEATAPRVIGSRDDFPAAPPKRAGLEDVIFSGGLLRNNDGTAWLYAGLSDAAAGRVRIDDPFAAESA